MNHRGHLHLKERKVADFHAACHIVRNGLKENMRWVSKAPDWRET